MHEHGGTMRKSFETAGPISARVRIPAGDVEVLAEGSGRTEVELDPQNRAAQEIMDRVTVELAGDRLTVEVPDALRLLGGAPVFGLRLHCPAGSSLAAATASADLVAKGRLGGLEAKTASGDVDVERVDGEAHVRTASGDVRLGDCGGPVDAVGTSGDLTIHRAGGGLKARSVSGDLQVEHLDGGAELHTVSGDVALDEVGPGSIRGSAVSGDMVVGVRPGCDVWMDVRSQSGHTQSHLEPQAEPGGDRSRMVEIAISTVSGDVRIERARHAEVL